MRKLPMILCTLIALAAVAACGGETPSDTSPTTVPESGAVAIQVADGFGAASTPTAADAYEANPTEVGSDLVETPTSDPESSVATATASIETIATTVAPSAITPTQQPVQEGRVPKQYPSAPNMVIDPNKSYTATIETNKGTVVAELFVKDAPVTVNNFVFLAREGYYDGVPFHRVIEGFMVQTGDPTGTGMGGPGYRFPDEPVTRPYEVGTLAMANAGPNTNGSQFFIVQGADGTRLPPSYTIFGKVTEGLDVVNEIASVPVGPSDGPQSEPSSPQEPLNIQTITIEEK
ncbi:MAG: peptidylprolyl isomerase [Chloroflexia bacterium]